jgi:histidinol-phosphate aminotransferase
MTITRRDFCGLLGATMLVPPELSRPQSGHTVPLPIRPSAPLRLDSNENPYGPSPAAREAIAKALADGGRYPSTGDLLSAVATANGVPEANVLLTVGATEGLYLAAKAFTRTDAPLVTAAPTYAAIATATEQLGHPVIRVPVRADGGLDLAGMAERARGAGLVFVCNPNNPTGVLTPAAELKAFIAALGAASPDATIVVGEVYHEYIDAPDYASVAPAALTNPRILVSRTFSKLYGLAGLRLGYLIGHEETLRKVMVHRVPLGANSLGIAAAIAALGDQTEVARQRRLNREGREAAERFFRDRNWRFYPAAANYLFVDVKRDIRNFRATCEEKGLLIGRYYPPADTWMRLTIGTPEEMRGAFAILRTVL